MNGLENKIIVITGGAGLLGRSFCEKIIQKNGIAIIAESDNIKGVEAESELKKKYGQEKVFYQQLDITAKEAILNLLSKLKSKFGKIDALVNCAYPRNKNYGRHFFDVEYEDFCENVNMHLGGYFLTSQQFGKYFKEQGWGTIINFSSIYGVIAPRFEIYDGTQMTVPVEYAVIKSALIQLTKYMAKYLKGSGVRVNSISPGGIFNNQPASFLNAYNALSLTKGMLDKTDIWGTLIFLLSDESRYINGQNIIVDDGFTL